MSWPNTIEQATAKNLTTTQIDLTTIEDDNLPADNPYFLPPSPTLPPSPKRGVKSNPSQLSNDVSHTGRLHTQSEKFLGTKKKANRPCPFCGSRAHGAKKCKTGSEIQERDNDRYNREMAAWKAGETTWTEGSVMGTNSALEKKIASLRETVLGLAKSIQEDRDKREKENQPVVVRTEDRMVRTGEMITRTGYLKTPGNGQYQPNVPPFFNIYPPEKRYLPPPSSTYSPSSILSILASLSLPGLF
ncbi:hypothetical protein TREMEDRAFT_64465 [Tremella mesenterica DSM 1558]|uniref:uncharacterized protein n=1 Tax=Tremella mesenterica (strain ATCC 24925 / CBS 8224 / DSM 1558 / NBRC 9311 / NRRL Y-6157 / RJB 2259-6 / UBC 559-6) TaxID=578456 RepID=UPI0003F4A150|nr:uncharacterized protein TREMEDRAFT_64465 [Tremella mesenterica DSM 1558]EIW67220.1 hypothetical protein TREMEDRAFT_64465 [Tremella mesenterica DSM 1558]